MAALNSALIFTMIGASDFAFGIKSMVSWRLSSYLHRQSGYSSPLRGHWPYVLDESFVFAFCAIMADRQGSSFDWTQGTIGGEFLTDDDEKNLPDGWIEICF
ncbi:MAG: hypothetical protein IPK94_05930 [Saprospiraceae bacterium]|nr:hypothetical protein [Saprospiraceae bacterium]